MATMQCSEIAAKNEAVMDITKERCFAIQITEVLFGRQQTIHLSTNNSLALQLYACATALL